MHRSRHREFSDVRSNSNLSKSETTSLRSSMSSSFRAPSSACVNCVNLHLSETQANKEKQLKLKQQNEFRNTYQSISQWEDPLKLQRHKMKIEAFGHNAQMIEEQKRKRELQKSEEKQYALRIRKSVLQAEQQQKKKLEEQKQKVKQYYSQIHNTLVYGSEDQKNMKNSRNSLENSKISLQNSKSSLSGSLKQNPEYQGLPIFDRDRSEEKLQYKKDLQKQIKEKQQKLKKQKIIQIQQQRRLMWEHQIQAQKYHGDHYVSKSLEKQEVFNGLKQLQKQKKQQKLELRKMNQKQRLQQLKQQNDMKTKALKQKMQEMQSYVNQLQKQIVEKQHRTKSQRLQDSQFVESFYKSTEELHTQLQVKKQCKQCKKVYPQSHIGQIPREA